MRWTVAESKEPLQDQDCGTISQEQEPMCIGWTVDAIAVQRNGVDGAMKVRDIERMKR